MNYLWTQNITPPTFPKLHGDAQTDVLIIGGGMAGILCAHFLKQNGINHILVEGKTIGNGITCGTTAVLTAQHDTLYTDLVSKFGSKKAKQYLNGNLWAVEQFRKMSQKIDCDFLNKPSFMYSRTDATKLTLESKILKNLGFSAPFVKKTSLPFDVAGAVRYDNMAQFHPLKFLIGISKGLNIYENTFVNKIKGNIAYTNYGNIKANKIIIATHFPFINSTGFYFMKMYQMRSFVFALENAPDLNGTYVDITSGGMYFRNYNNLLLVGGGDHRTGAKGGGFSEVEDFIKHYLPNSIEKYKWATQDCMTLDGVPYIGNYASNTPNMYVATGFNEWGMTSSMLSASILTDMIIGHESKFATIFKPKRSMLQPQLFANMGTTVCDFLLPTTKRCSHLGCALKWNSAEHSWDCPCHGSRFDDKGEIIDNPTQKRSNIN